MYIYGSVFIAHCALCSMATSLSSRGYSIQKDSIPADKLAAIKKELTVSPVVPPEFSAMMRPSAFPLYMESTTRIYVPKCYGLQKFGVPAVNKLEHQCKDIDIEFGGTLRPEQHEPAGNLISACRDPQRRGGILNLYCGGGKTTISLYIIAALKKKAIIVVHKDFLLNQWKERIEQFVPSARVGLIKAKVMDTVDKDIVLASLQSLSMKEYPKELFDEFGTCVIDEVHHTSAEVFSQALKKINCLYSVGLSATIKRKDGLSKVFLWFLGDVEYKSTKRIDKVRVMCRRFYEPDPLYSREHYIKNNMLNTARMINNVCEYFPRIEFLTTILKSVLEKEPERKVLILSDRRQHLTTMHAYFTRIGLDCGVYMGGMKQTDLALCEQKQIILATFAIASEGYDQKGLDTLVLASPKSDITQSVGRILRDKENERKHVPLVIDIIDDFSIFEKQADKRIKWYRANKYEVDTTHDATSFDINFGGVCLL